MPGSNIISSTSSSYFFISKNASTGLAELYYVPSRATLLNGALVGTEIVTVLKGMPGEKNLALIVKAK